MFQWVIYLPSIFRDLPWFSLSSHTRTQVKNASTVLGSFRFLQVTKIRAILKSHGTPCDFKIARKICIKWLRSMAPMTSDLSGFITTLTFFPQGMHLHTHTHMHTHTHPHTHGRRYISTASQMRSTWSTQKDSCSTINDSHLCVFSTFCTRFYNAEKTTKHSFWRWR